MHANFLQPQLFQQWNAFTLLQQPEWPIAQWTKLFRSKVTCSHQDASVGRPRNRNKVNVQVQPKNSV